MSPRTFPPEQQVRDIHSLSLAELKALVAEDTAWRDSVAAISRVHHVLSEGDTDWTQMLTAGFLGIGGPDVSMALRVARDLNHPKIAAAPTLFEIRECIIREAIRIRIFIAVKIGLV